MAEELKSKKRGTFLGLPKKELIYLLSGMAAIIIVFLALIFTPPRLHGLFLGVGILIVFIPYSIINYLEKALIKNLEDNLPDFLRDLAEDKKSGMTLPQAISKSARVDYGKLTPEIQKMASQISWGVPFDKALEIFSKKHKSRFIERSIAIIIEAQRSSGAVVETLESVARDARLIKESEKERKSKLSQQAMIMYAVFFMFMAIIISLQKLMIPLVFSKGFTIATTSPEKILNFYSNIFFYMIMIQAIFNGLLAGQISEGSPILGLKHSVVFLVVGIIVSWAFIF